MKAKTFDCVEMKRRGADQLQQRLAGMPPLQELEFWHKQTDEIRRRQQDIRQKLTLQSR
jgi:hypothetical protein